MSMKFLQSLNEAKLHGHILFNGLDISIEIPAGGERTGTNKKTGEKWSHHISDSYGYIKGTHSPDGEHLDCYLRKNPNKNCKVYVVHQMTVDGTKFDEDKVMLGYSSKSEAIKAFKDFTFKPSVMFGGCTEFEMDYFQIIAFSASKSKAMLTDEKTYAEFKKRGHLTQGIKSPLMVAKSVSESLKLGLQQIGESITKGDIEECLEASSFDNGGEVKTILSQAYDHYKNTPYMHHYGTLDESEFNDRMLDHIMQEDALATDTETDIDEEVSEEIVSDTPVVLEDDADPVEDSIDTEPEPEPELEESNNYVVVLHTQMMENIGSKTNPSWATAGTRVILVQEGFTTYGQARSAAAKVSSGQIPVELAEGSYVLGIDVMPIGDYRYLYEPVEITESIEPEYDMLAEARKLAGIKPVTFSPRATPTLHEVKAKLNELDDDQLLFVPNTPREEEKLTKGQRAHALRVLIQTLKKNPNVSVTPACIAVCKALYGDDKLYREVMNQAKFEYGSIDRMVKVARNQEDIKHGPRTKTKIER